MAGSKNRDNTASADCVRRAAERLSTREVNGCWHYRTEAPSILVDRAGGPGPPWRAVWRQRRHLLLPPARHSSSQAHHSKDSPMLPPSHCSPTSVPAEASASLRRQHNNLTELMCAQVLFLAQVCSPLTRHTHFRRGTRSLFNLQMAHWSHFPLSCSTSPGWGIIPGAPLARVPAG